MTYFHIHDNWYTYRRDDGGVVIFSAVEGWEPGFGIDPGWVAERLAMDPDTWASVVAFVGKGGDTAERHKTILELHQ